MLNQTDYIEKFKEVQAKTVDATKELLNKLEPGLTELDIATLYYDLLKSKGLTEHWYPILIYIGETTARPITRREHLPSADKVLKKNDIIFVDSTPMDITVWGNWCETIVFGEDVFLQELINDCSEVVRKTAEYTRTEAKTVGDVFDFSMKIIEDKKLTVLDPYKDVGHTIFQVEAGQTVDKTPMQDRTLLNSSFAHVTLTGIISIEPQVGRTHPETGVMFGAKNQEVVII